MQHQFQIICPDADALLNNVDTLSTFMRRIDKLSKSDDWRLLNKTPEEFKGEALEAFVEVLINNSSIDKRINIINYRPHNSKTDGDDMGIDGYGNSHNGNLHTIQIKYRSNVVRNLTANEDHISNFVAKTTSDIKYRDADMTIFTTAKDLNQKVNEEMYNDRVRVIGYNDLKKLVDRNTAFWNIFRTEMGV